MKFKNLFGLVVFATMMISAVGLNAQIPGSGQNQQQEIEVSDSELQTFAEIMQQAQQLQRQAQMSIMNAVKESDLEMNRFQEISQAQRQGQEVDMTQEEQEAYSDIQEVMNEEQEKMGEEITSVFDNSSMERQRYMEINTALRGNKELQDRLKQIMGAEGQQ